MIGNEPRQADMNQRKLNANEGLAEPCRVAAGVCLDSLIRQADAGADYRPPTDWPSWRLTVCIQRPNESWDTATEHHAGCDGSG